MTSDLHVDHWFKTNQRNEDVKALSKACLDASYHYINHRVSLENYINNALKPADVLCVAGDTCDDPHLFVEFYKTVSPRYKKIFVVFGNHDLTVHNESFFRNNPFTETQSKLDFLKVEISKFGNVSILDGTVEEIVIQRMIEVEVSCVSNKIEKLCNKNCNDCKLRLSA